MKKRHFPCAFRLNCTGILVVRNSSNKRRIGNAALIGGRRLSTFCPKCGAYSRRWLFGGKGGGAYSGVNTVALRYAFTSTLLYEGTVIFLSRNEIVRMPVDVDFIRELNRSGTYGRA